ncbi:ParA family protein [Microbacterium sp.]|uniref:ParA family protein n=1 Tax=Microbacterium sp. TaxID=51671 RepID=UPI003F707CA0
MTRAYATVTGPTATYIAPDGHSEPITVTGTEDIRLAIVRRAADEARRTGEPVELVTSGDRGDHHLLIHTDGTLAPLPDSESTRAALRARGTASEAGVDERGDRTLPTSGLAADREEVTSEAPQPDTDDNPDVPIAEPVAAPRPTFLTPTPASSGSLRGFLSALGIVKASEIDPDVATVSTHWAGCRTIGVANGKGGVGKTMTTAMIAAVLARFGGGNVLAWDNNDTRGTLGWRTQTGLYDTTIRDLLHHAHDLLTPDAAVSDISRYVHHQAADRYDVLRSNPELLAADQRLSREEFDLLMQVAARYYRLVVWDSGNDESADRWLRMIDSTTQLVIPTLAAPESAESAALLLDALRTRDPHSHTLAEKAVVIVTQSEPTRRGELDRIVDGFAPHVRAVTVIPFDPALKSGALMFDNLRPRTRTAWVRATAAAAEGL